MSTLYFQKSFLKKVRSHLGELIQTTELAHIYMNSPSNNDAAKCCDETLSISLKSTYMKNEEFLKDN